MAEHERTYSQVQGDYMKPVYEQVTMGGGRGAPTQGKLLGYELDPTLLKKIEVPKPPAILAEEKRIGKTIDPVYKTYDGPGGDIPYGPPVSYKYDKGDNEYANFDAEGRNIGGTTINAKNIGLPLILAMAGAPFIAPALGGFFGGSGAAAAGTLGAAEGALTAAELASLPSAATGIGALGSAGTLGAAEGALTAAEMAGLPSLGATLGASEGALTAAELASLPSAGTTLGAATGATHLTPAAMESLMGTGGYGVNASALEAAAAAGIPAAQVGAGASSAFPGVTPHLTPAQIESLANTPGYGKSAAAASAAASAGLDPNNVGLNADLPFPGVNPSIGITDLLKKAKDKLLGTSDTSSGSGLGGALGLMALMAMMNKGGGATAPSTATIPELTATRSQLPYDVDKKGVNPNTPYRPGQGGVSYFSPTTYTPKAAGGGLMSLGGYSDGGRLLQGPGDGVSDSIPAIIGKKQPARLANGEFVIPARIVSELGNGSTDAGAKRLYEMMSRVQNVRRKTKNVAANTKAAKYLPA
jgi:hypothetical protein